MNKLRIGTRLALAFALMLTLTLTLGAFAISQLGEVRQVANDISEKWMAAARFTAEINTDSSNFRIAEIQHILSSEPEEKAKYEKEMEAIAKNIEKNASSYAALIRSEKEKSMWDEFNRERRRYLDEHERIKKLSLANEMEDAKSVLRYNSQQKYERASAALRRLVDYNVNEGQAAAAASATTYNAANSWIVMAMLVALALGTLLAVTITRSIVKPLRAALNVAETAAMGDLTTTVNVVGRDDAAKLLSALQHMNEGLSTLVSGVRAGSDQIAIGSREIAQGNADLSYRTEQQASNLQQIVYSMEKVSEGVKETAEAANNVTELANSASHAAVEGGQVITSVVDTMHEITAATARIGEITGLIDSIAFQTNILALNAAVEAARAGEMGRGFAVVASEVRMLAHRSAEAAKEIKSLIKDSNDKVKAGGRLVDDALKSVHLICHEVSSVNEMVSRISAATSEQASSIDVVCNAVTKLDIATQQNSALVEESAAASENLAEQAQYLVNAVAAFKVAQRVPLEEQVQEACAKSSEPPRLSEQAARRLVEA